MATPKHRSAAPQPAVRSRRSTPRPRPASGGRAAPAPRRKAAAPNGARTPSAAPAAGRSRRGPAVPKPSTHRNGRPRRPPIAPGRHKRGRRYAVVYDLDGPRVRLGIAWFLLIMGALAIDRLVLDIQLLPFVMAGVAAAAAMEIVDAWQGAAVGSDRYVAGASAAAIGMSAVLGARLTGLVVLLVVVVALVVAGMRATRRSSILAGAGLTLQACLLPGITAAGVVLSMRYEIGAVLLLLFFVCAFDLGDFLVGSGADSVIEGPIAGAGRHPGGHRHRRGGEGAALPRCGCVGVRRARGGGLPRRSDRGRAAAARRHRAGACAAPPRLAARHRAALGLARRPLRGQHASDRGARTTLRDRLRE